MKTKLHPISLTGKRSLQTLVENRTAFTLDKCELNIFETHQQTELIPLTFNDFVVTSMLRGKKIMHLFEKKGFDYLPGESVLVPAGITMHIDFPEASIENPTQCIALAIDHKKIEKTINFLQEQYPRIDNSSWEFNRHNYHFQNNIEIAGLLNKIIQICTSTLPLKDILADLNLQELIIHIIQAQNRLELENTSHPYQSNSSPLAFITSFIQANINEDIHLGVLSEKACMSKATFYRSFKKEFGISPLEYIMSEKIKKAKQLLSNSSISIKNIAFECGFKDVNYFVRAFKKNVHFTPGQFQQMLIDKDSMK